VNGDGGRDLADFRSAGTAAVCPGGHGTEWGSTVPTLTRPDEAAAFLNQVMSLDLSATDVSTLETRTEGWIAGLKLAALSLQNHGDVQTLVHAFSGGTYALFGGTLQLAKGAPGFALGTGAALIPIFVVPAAGGYEVRVEPALRATSDRIDDAEEECISAYVPLLERYVVAYPCLWRGWLGPPSYWRPDPVAESR